MRLLYSLALLLVLPVIPAFATPPAKSNVWMEEMTWPEIAASIKAGDTTVIVPTGGTEQNGPAIVLGKHNFILKYTAMTIAQRLGHTLVSPIMAYVPEGDIHPPAGHMRFAGTLSLRPETFALVLEDTARSLKEHGFKTICFVGEHGASQAVQKQVAEKLDTEWKGEGVRVIHVGDYYDAHNHQAEWAKKMYVADPDIEAHGGFADTSEMLSVYPRGVRTGKLADYTPADMDKTGAEGTELKATRELGAGLVELKVEAAVTEIEQVTGQKPVH